MRQISIVILISFLALATAPVPLLADEPGHSCAKAEKSCCKAEKADANCCATAADGTHACSMKHADGTACAGSTCCKDKSCAVKKTT
jgi:hypothetical protein